MSMLKVLKLLVFILFLFFHDFKYYGQNIFSGTMLSYLIAKIERKEQTLYLKHEIILNQKEKRTTIFQVKMISKDIRKMIVPSLCFFLI